MEQEHFQNTDTYILYILHFLLYITGQFWNVEISVEDYVGEFRNGEVNNLVLVTLRPSDRDARTFPAWREQKV